jgi:hypothetical protein
VALLVAASGTAASAQQLACHGVEQPREIAELVFGRRIGSRGAVGEAAWRRFVAREITPRFPEGITLIDASGQWRDPASGRIVREPATIVIIAMPGKPDDHERVDEIAGAYKTRFQQRSVGIMIRAACVSF